MSSYSVLVEMSDEHIARKHPSVIRIGYVLDAFGNILPQIEIEADDGITNSIYMDLDMLEDSLMKIVDMIHELEVAER